MIDFQALKAKLRIEEVAKAYVELTQEGEVWRAPCPVCAPRNHRSIVITPSKQLYYCFSRKGGGDVISLVAHVREVSQRSAAEMLVAQYFGSKEKESDALEPLNYLDADHPLVSEAGFPKEVCERVGIGYASKGLMRTYIAIPIRLEDGTLVGYVGVKDARLPPKWRLP